MKGDWYACDVTVCFCDGRQPWILWWKRIWKLTWPAGTFRNTSKRTLSRSTLNIFLNDPTCGSYRRKKRDCQGINGASQHASWTHVNIQHETFQVLLHTKLSGSSDKWSWRHLCAMRRVERSLRSVTMGQTFTRDRRWIGLLQQVKPWTNELPKAEACYLRRKLSGCIF